MKRRLIVLGALLLLGAVTVVGVRAFFWDEQRDLILVARDLEAQITKAGLPVFNDKVPSKILLLLNPNQQQLLKQKKLAYQLIYQDFKPSPQSWFIDSAEVCSPCFTNTVGSFSKILWRSDYQFLVEGESKKIRYILNNQAGQVVAYGLGPGKPVLRASASSSDETNNLNLQP